MSVRLEKIQKPGNDESDGELRGTGTFKFLTLFTLTFMMLDEHWSFTLGNVVYIWEEKYKRLKEQISIFWKAFWQYPEKFEAYDPQRANF